MVTKQENLRGRFRAVPLARLKRNVEVAERFFQLGLFVTEMRLHDAFEREERHLHRREGFAAGSVTALTAAASSACSSRWMIECSSLNRSTTLRNPSLP